MCVVDYSFPGAMVDGLVATGRFVGQGSVWPGVSCVFSFADVLVAADMLEGAMNFETGETVAVKEIQLSNIPKGELPEIMVSITCLHCQRRCSDARDSPRSTC
jgi:hypothetical protein